MEKKILKTTIFILIILSILNILIINKSYAASAYTFGEINGQKNIRSTYNGGVFYCMYAGRHVCQDCTLIWLPPSNGAGKNLKTSWAQSGLDSVAYILSSNLTIHQKQNELWAHDSHFGSSKGHSSTASYCIYGDYENYKTYLAKLRNSGVEAILENFEESGNFGETISGESKILGPINIKYQKNVFRKENFSGIKSVTINENTACEVLDRNKNPIALKDLEADTQIYIRIPASTVCSKVKVTYYAKECVLDAAWKCYVTRRPGAPSYCLKKSLQNVFWGKASMKTNEGFAEIDISSGTQCDIEFRKVDEGGTALTGAKFKIVEISKPSTANAKEDQIIELGSQRIRFSFKENGTYVYEITETSAPEGYEPIYGSIILTIDVNGNTATATANCPEGVTFLGNTFVIKDKEIIDGTPCEIEFQKTNESGLNISDAVFTIEEISKPDAALSKADQILEIGNKKIRFIFKENGRYVYRIREQEAPEGFEAMSESIILTIDVNDGIATATATCPEGVTFSGNKFVIKNKKEPTTYRLRIIKEWSSSSGRIGIATFNIQGPNGLWRCP